MIVFLLEKGLYLEIDPRHEKDPPQPITVVSVIDLRLPIQIATTTNLEVALLLLQVMLLEILEPPANLPKLQNFAILEAGLCTQRLFVGARNPRFDPTAYIKDKERKKKEASMKKSVSEKEQSV